MSRETLHLMLKLNTEDLDTQVALQCAPLLTGMKISNLLTVGRSKRAAVLELFKETAVSCCILYESSEKTTFLLYIRPALEAVSYTHLDVYKRQGHYPLRGDPQGHAFRRGFGY